MQYLDLFCLLAAILMMPLIPALLIYIKLPSRTSVQGPFKGLNIRLTGAFGGYFLIVLIAVGISYSYSHDKDVIKDLKKRIIRKEERIQKTADLDLWDIKCELEVQDLERPPKKGDFEVVLVPELYDIYAGGNNKVNLHVKVPIGTYGNKELKMPYTELIVEYQQAVEHEIIAIYLSEKEAIEHNQKIYINQEKNKIKVKSVEIMKR